MKKLLIMMVIAGLSSTWITAGAADKVVLPKGYEKWAKSGEKVVNDRSSLFYGIHHIYVDAKAMAIYKTGGVYPEGSRFIVEQFGIRQEGGNTVKGKKSMIVLMKKDKNYKETGGWLFAGFTAEGKPSGIDPVKNCFECHLKEAKETDLIISRFADFK